MRFSNHLILFLFTLNRIGVAYRSHIWPQDVVCACECVCVPVHKCVYLSTSVLLQLEGEKTLWFSANRWLMESNQSLYLKKGIQFSVFGAHSSGLICNPVCSGPDLLTPSLYSPLDWGTTYISLERHKMSLEMISGFETSVSVDFNWTQVFVCLMYVGVCCVWVCECVCVYYIHAFI